MHTRYYQTHRGIFQPDRRERQIPYERPNRRHVEGARVTSREVEFLRGGLQDLKRTVGSMYRLTRRIRHTVVAVSLAILFMGGVMGEITGWVWITPWAMSLLAVANAYLIVYSTRTTIYRCRLNHRRRCIENVLERFGFPTAFGIAQQHRAWSHEPERLKRYGSVIRSTQLALNAYDVVLTLIVVAAYVVSVQSVFSLDANPSIVLVLLRALTVLAIAVSIASVVLFAVVRSRDESLAAEFMKEHALWIDCGSDDYAHLPQ
jgi:hypothetical protein